MNTAFPSLLNDYSKNRPHPVFAEPWEAHAFAIVVKLSEKGLFKWSDWTNTLAEEIKEAKEQGNPDFGNTYYKFWLTALETIILEKNIANEEEIFNFAIEKGSIDFETNEDTYSIYCDVKNYHNLIQNISKKYSAPKSHQIFWQSKEKVEIEKDSAEILFKLINKLEENDDVQSVFSNFEVSDEIMNQLIN